jgi:hypothetical protein
MPSIVIVNRDGSLRNLAVGTWNDEDLYKKAGFKSPNGFEIATKFSVPKKITGPATQSVVEVYGKTSGKANSENKYDFPPPIDSTLFFGACVLVMRDRETKEVQDLKVDTWNAIYEALFGGFEDLTGGKMGIIAADMMDRILDEREMDEEEKRILNDPKTQFTKSGYVKDDFIVDDEDDEDEEVLEDDLSSCDSDSTPPRRQRPARKPVAKKTPAAVANQTEATVPAAAEPKTSKSKTKSTKDSKPRKPKAPSSRPKRGGGFVAVRANPSVDNAEYECKEELVEEEYLATAPTTI